MKLTVLSDYGSKVKEISSDATVDEIKKTMDSINWIDFHQVVLTIDKKNWIEVGGNLADDGLSVVYSETGKQFIIERPPDSVNKITTILISFLEGDGNYKIENTFIAE
jgi:hypothetical protein